MRSDNAIISVNGGPRSVVAEPCDRTRQSASLQCGSASPGGPRSVVAASLPARNTPAHHPILAINNRSPIVFLTVCSHDRRPLFDKSDIHELMKSVWGAASAWHVGRYVLMPDHIHLFCAPNGLDAPPLARWVQFWKSAASRRWPRTEEQPVWQKSFWDTQLRRGESYGEKWEYVRRNPVRSNLCADSMEWPFQGEMNILLWHD
jgi:REP element-mobilizing transposase RayT